MMRYVRVILKERIQRVYGLRFVIFLQTLVIQPLVIIIYDQGRGQTYGMMRTRITPSTCIN